MVRNWSLFILSSLSLYLPSHPICINGKLCNENATCATLIVVGVHSNEMIRWATSTNMMTRKNIYEEKEEILFYLDQTRCTGIPRLWNKLKLPLWAIKYHFIWLRPIQYIAINVYSLYIKPRCELDIGCIVSFINKNQFRWCTNL